MNALRIVALFLIFGSSWIFATDHALDIFVDDESTRASLQSIKGIAFVALSALLIYVLVKRAERQQAVLRAAAISEKDHLAQILNINPAVIYSLRPTQAGSRQFVVDIVGNNVEQITGYPVSHWRAQPDFWQRHVHKDDVQSTQAAQAALFQNNQVRHEYRFLHADGNYRWINDNLVLLRDTAGHPAQILGSWLDVTERKQAEIAITESEQRYKALFDANPLPMWVFDEETLRFLSVNQAALDKYGYSHSEFMAMTIMDIRPEDEHQSLLAFVSPEARALRALAQRDNQPHIWRHRKKDGSLFWVEVSGHTLVHHGRRGRLILAQDISDRMQAEERMRLIGSVFQASQEGIFITDAQAHFISINDAFTHITGYTMDDVQGETPKLLHSGRHDKPFYEEMWRQIQTEGRWEGDIWNRKKNR